jgi:uncharacterized protein (DUF1330 family)
MKTNHKLTLAVLAGVLIGVAGATAIHAQQAKAAPGYVIAEVEVTDPTTLKKYGEKAPQIVADFNGHYVVRGGKTQALEGEPPKGYIVVIGFDSVEKRPRRRCGDNIESRFASRRSPCAEPLARHQAHMCGQRRR